MAEKEKVLEKLVEEKEVNVVSFDEVMTNRNEQESMESYFSKQDLKVTRGELYQVLNQVLGNIDNELIQAFQRIVIIQNLVDVLVEALVEKNVISDEDLSNAQQALIAKLEAVASQMEEEGNSDGE